MQTWECFFHASVLVPIVITSFFFFFSKIMKTQNNPIKLEKTHIMKLWSCLIQETQNTLRIDYSSSPATTKKQKGSKSPVAKSNY